MTICLRRIALSCALLCLSPLLCACGDTTKTDDATATTTATTTTTTASSGFDEAALLAQLTTREYIYTAADGEQCVFYEITNGSDRDLYITVTADFLKGGTTAYTESDDIEILASGATYAIYFTPQAAFDTIRYTANVYGTQKAPAALSCAFEVSENGVEFLTCTNTSARDANAFAGYVLYFSGETVVDFDITYFSPAAGESETENVDTDAAYDSYKIYVGGALTE